MTENSSLSSSTVVDCPNLLLILPYQKQFSTTAEVLTLNATTFDEVRRNQFVVNEMSRLMIVYGALQAIMHFNQRNNTVVAITGEYVNSTCPNLYVPSVTISSSEDAFYDDILGLGGEKNDDVVFLPDLTCGNADELLSIVGPMDSNVMEEVAIYANDQNMFLMTPFSFFDETKIKKADDSKNLVRLTTDAKHLATKFVDYLRFLERDYVAILYDGDCTFSNQVLVNIRDSKGNLTITEFGYSCKADIDDPQHCKRVLSNLQLTLFSTIIFIEGEKSYQDLDQIIRYSVEYGLVTNEHMWIIIRHELNDDCYIYRALKCFPRGSKEELFVRGLSIYDYRNQDCLLEEELNSSLLSLIRSKNISRLKEAQFYQVFQKKSLSNAAYVYDTVITMLFLLCEKSLVGKESLLTLFKLLPIDVFGATGLFSLDDDGIRVNLEYSLWYIGSDTCSNGIGIGSKVIYDVNTNETWNAVADGMYFDGNAAPPFRLRLHNEDMNYLTPVESWGFFVEVILIICICVFLSLKVVKFKYKRRVQLGQPFYLLSVCFCCALFSLHILPYGLDENNAPVGQENLDMLCVMMPIVRSACFLFLLYTVFIKLRVIWKELKSSSQVNYRAEFLSSLILIPLTVTFGIMVRSISSKYYRWNRVVLERDEYSFIISSKGQCFMDERFITESLQCLMTLVALIMTFIVYRKFEVQTLCERVEHIDLINESKQIFAALAVHGILNAATVFLLTFFNQTIHAEASRPFTISTVFPYLWFIVVHSLRSENTPSSNDSNEIVEDIVISGRDDVSDLSSITGVYDMDEEGGPHVQVQTAFDVLQINITPDVSDTSIKSSSDCSLISTFHL